MSNLSSLFAMMARGEEDPAPPVVEENKPLVYAVPCRYCGSDETQPVSEEHEIYECRRCGEVFHRT